MESMTTSRCRRTRYYYSCGAHRPGDRTGGAVDAGYEGSIAPSGNPEKIDLSTTILAPVRSHAGRPTPWRCADIVCWHPLQQVSAGVRPSLGRQARLVDKPLTLAAGDGVQEMFEDHRYGSNRDRPAPGLARSTIVKSLNHIATHELVL